GFSVFGSTWVGNGLANMAYFGGSGSTAIGTDGGIASGGAGHIEFRTGGYGSAQERMRIISTGEIGIGTTAPGARLDITDASTTTSAIILPRAGNFTGTNVNGMMRYNTSLNKFEAYENGGWINIIGGGSATSVSANAGTELLPSVSFSGDPDTGWWHPAANTMAASTAGTERVRIDPTGNVGIGTTSPAKKLHIQSVGGNGILIETTGANTQPTLQLANPGTWWEVSNDGTDGNKFKITDATGPSTRLTIDSSGNVGVGTTSPTAKLDVAGNISATSNDSITIDAINSLGGGQAIHGWAGNTNGVGINGEATAIGGIGVRGAANVGISGYFQANSAANINPTLVTQQNGAGIGDLFQAQNAAGTALVNISSAGNLGIGTSTPVSKLDILGNVNVGGTDVNGNYGVQFVNRTDHGLFQAANTSNIYLSSLESIRINIDSNNNSTSTFSIAHSGNGEAGGLELFRIQEDGNVGIGTTSPAFLVHTYGTADYTNGIQMDTPGTGNDQT
ncbi:MAG: hypothetical protein AABZ55_01550, partial [Bdellovibrionota bacterium]